MRQVLLGVALIFLSAGNVFADNFVEAGELRTMIEQKKEVILIDIQTPEDFTKRHIQGSIETNAYPAKSEDEKKRLDKALPTIKASTAPVVVVCPRGKSGAKNSYDYLISKGIPENRLQILKGGIAAWPYQELLGKPKN